jgi:hypothetical protein
MPPEKLYEYKLIPSNVGTISDEKLNKFGLDGWRIVAVTDTFIVLEREL